MSNPPPMAGNPAPPFKDISASLVPNSQSSAAQNAVVAQSILNAASSSNRIYLAILTPGLYYFDQIIMHSYSEIYIGAGVTVKRPDSYPLSMFINYGATLASPVRDADIALRGPGTIDGNATNQTGRIYPVSGTINPNTFWYGIQGDISMIDVDNFVFEVENLYNSYGFGVQYCGKNGLIQNVSLEVYLDFAHINGPTSCLRIRNCRGFSNDDFIALNAWDWHGSSPHVGDIDDFEIDGCVYRGSNGIGGRNTTGAYVKFLSGTRTTGVGQGFAKVINGRVSNYNCVQTDGLVAQTQASFIFPGDYDSPANEYSGVAFVGNISIEQGYAVANSTATQAVLINKTTSSSPADGQNTLTLQNIIFSNGHFDCSSGSCYHAVSFNIPYNSLFVSEFVFRDMEWTPASLVTDQEFLEYISKTTCDDVEIDGLVINSSAATGATAAAYVGQYTAGVASVVNSLTVDRVKTAPGYQIPKSWLQFGGVVNRLRSRGNFIIGSASGADNQGICLTASTAQVTGVIEDSYFNGVKCGIYIPSGIAPSANAVTLNFRDCDILNCTHPVFINGAFNADISYNRCDISTATNLARVSTGTLSVSYRDTTATGAGAATVSLVSSGVVDFRSTDRIVISPTVVQTPQNNDIVNFSATPTYTGVNVISGTGAGLYIYRGTGTVGWIKLN